MNYEDYAKSRPMNYLSEKSFPFLVFQNYVILERYKSVQDSKRFLEIGLPYEN